MTSFLGGSGELVSSAGSNVLDAFARWAESHGGGTRVVSVSWDVWRDVGMAVNAPVPSALRAQVDRSVAHGILPSEGVEVFTRILGAPVSEVVVSTRDLSRLAESRAAATTRPGSWRADGGLATGAADGGPSSPTESMSDLEQLIAVIWGDLLGVEHVDRYADFFELGGHSLLATQVMARLYQRFGVDVPLRSLFEAHTLAAFAERVDALVHRGTADREEIEI
jgi:hypothetical protein